MRSLLILVFSSSVRLLLIFPNQAKSMDDLSESIPVTRPPSILL
ncbi:hypothetical protein ECANGB1_2735 [Enterospora canceri]|uniref:Uncharacterized protein n=1 Tax=Enterospora canceri TaxID=1081671 RepID=A0A1Y1S4D9_9MICR|nr:hypothetical protein ECANGB1_2735 [Enterospora canceri]